MDSCVPEKFYQFCDPIEVYKHTRPSNDAFINADFMLSKKKLIEAAAGARLALCMNILYGKKIQMCLLPEQSDHDFDLTHGDEIMRFQFTERLEQDRQRDREYKNQQQGKVIPRPYRPARNTENAIPWIVEAIRKKMRYSDKPSLLVYVNFNCDLIPFDTLVSEVNKIEGIQKYFASIWALLSISFNYDETSIGRLFPLPDGWLDFNCATGKRL